MEKTGVYCSVHHLKLRSRGKISAKKGVMATSLRWISPERPAVWSPRLPLSTRKGWRDCCEVSPWCQP
uniref:Uncharacterized protein n=1 Tax=Hyaloperonospora arabidopsidis (strain Emoy2) TaxID=559515 RepID=M4B224_HYAAE